MVVGLAVPLQRFKQAIIAAGEPALLRFERAPHAPSHRGMKRTVLLIVAALASCAPGSHNHSGASLRVDAVGSLTDAAGLPRQLVLGATRAGLTATDSNGHIVPGLASSWRVANDGHSIIFRLRSAKWPDGTSLVAADVVTSFRKLAASANPARDFLGGIENSAAIARGNMSAAELGIDAPVANVVEIHMVALAAELLAALALPDLAVRRDLPRSSARNDLLQPGLGPFIVANATARPLVLQPNPHSYVAGSVAAGEIDLSPVDDPGVAVSDFAHNRTDLVIGRDLAGLSDARLLGPQVLHVEPAWGVYGYLVNVRRGPLADARVRRALAMAIDRASLGPRLFGLALQPVTSVLPLGTAGDPMPALPDWAILAPAERLTTARALLTAAGYDAAHPLKLEVSLPVGREHAAVLAAVAADWEAIGVSTTLLELDAKSLDEAVTHDDFELALSETTVPVNAPALLLARFRCGANPGGYCNPAADAALARAPVELGALAEAEMALLADPPLIPLFQPVRWALVARGVTGWADNVAGQHPLARLGVAGRRQ